jgi:hypothetical protein
MVRTLPLTPVSEPHSEPGGTALPGDTSLDVDRELPVLAKARADCGHISIARRETNLPLVVT